MVFRFRRSIGLIPGVRLNLSKSGPSVSLGVRGLRHTIGLQGSRTTVGLPGTGLSWTEYTPHRSKRDVVLEPRESFRLDSYHDGSQTEEKEIDSAAISSIAARSTSELASILEQMSRRWRFSRLTMYMIVIAIGFALYSKNHEWLLFAFGLMVVGVPLTSLADRYRRTIKVQYNLSSEAEIKYNSLLSAFEGLRASKRVWHIPAEQRTFDWKRNAGASSLVKRRSIAPRLRRPACMRANIRFPTLNVGIQNLQFGPDAVLVFSQKSIATLSYNDLIVSSSTTRFIEDDRVPKDSVIVGQTWQYPNKRGGPDRRFTNNRQLPICLYGEVNFESAGGLCERIQCSNTETADRFAVALDSLREASFPNTISTIRRAGVWPVVCLSVFGIVVCLALGLVSAGDPNVRKLIHGLNSSLSSENSGGPISEETPKPGTSEASKVNSPPPLPQPRQQKRSPDPWANLRK